MLKLSPQSINDLETIYEFTLRTWGISKADKYQDEFYTTRKTIVDNPSIDSLYYFKEGSEIFTKEWI